MVLLAIGAVSIGRSKTSGELPYAAIPVIFAIQQLVEGGLWLDLQGNPATAHLLTIIYLLFSNVLWPVYVPLAVRLIETSPARRRALAYPLAVGVAIGLFFLYNITTNPVSAAIEGAHIRYNLPHRHHDLVFSVYALATCFAPLLSSHRTVRWLGVAIIVSMIGSYAAYALWFASVWCFFAAMTSAVVLLHFSSLRAPATGDAPARSA